MCTIFVFEAVLRREADKFMSSKEKKIIEIENKTVLSMSFVARLVKDTNRKIRKTEFIDICGSKNGSSRSAVNTGEVGCIILPKVIGFIDSPHNSIIWTTNSSPSEKNLKDFHKQGPPLQHLGYVYAVLSKALPRKSFSLKILLAMLKMTRFLKIFHYHGPKFEIKF